MCPETRGSPEAHKGRVTALLLGVNCVGPKNGVVGWFPLSWETFASPLPCAENHTEKELEGNAPE